MQQEVVSKLIPGFVVFAQSFGTGRIGILAYEWESGFPNKYGIYLIENSVLKQRLSALHWVEATGFIGRCWVDADRDNEVFWRLLSYRIRERGGAHQDS